MRENDRETLRASDYKKKDYARERGRERDREKEN